MFAKRESILSSMSFVMLRRSRHVYLIPILIVAHHHSYSMFTLPSTIDTTLSSHKLFIHRTVSSSYIPFIHSALSSSYLPFIHRTTFYSPYPPQVRGSPSVKIHVRRSMLGPIITDNGVASELGLSGDARHTLAMLWVGNDPSVSDAATNIIMSMAMIMTINEKGYPNIRF